MDTTEVRRRLGAALRCLEAGHWRRAEAECDAVLAANPRHVEIGLLKGLAVSAMGEPSRAAPTLEKVMRVRPDYAHPCDDLAVLHPSLPPNLVAAQYRACLRLAPGNVSLRHAFAGYLLDHNAAEEAISVLDGSLDCASAHNLMGMALAELGRYRAAIKHFQQVIALDPKAAIGWSNLGFVLKVERWFDEAAAAYDQAIALAPEDAQIRVNRAVALLQAGRWMEAWQDYEWRLQPHTEGEFRPERLLPSLADRPDLHGRTVLAVHEEGFGDTLHFARYLPMLAERGARVIAMVPRPLERIIRSVEGVVDVISTTASLPYFDYHCPFFSLPRAFGTTVATIPGNSYLRADAALVARWSLLLPRQCLRVGLVWAGQARPWLPGFTGLNRRRSIPLQTLGSLATTPSLTFVSLQTGPAAVQALCPPHGMTLVNVMDQVTDFADTAAIVANLDVIVSVDTAVVHLAGGMGKPVMMLDRYDNCWRWLSGRSDSPWYPNLKIFRQHHPNDWAGPVAQVAATLRNLAASRVTPGSADLLLAI
jgi:Tfp pilus assembly protein PilF